MRLWHCSPEALPNALLLNQHRTTHLLLKGIAEQNGVVGRYARHAGFVVWVHWTCTQEMTLRGMHHDSPILPVWRSVPESLRAHNPWIPNRTYVRDELDLAAKSVNSNLVILDDARMPVPEGIAKFKRDLRVVSSVPLLPNHVLLS